jgi:pimeloyl-ACP methyl ester carboxylesterase
MKQIAAAGVNTAYLQAGDQGPVIVLLSCGLFGGGTLQGLFPPTAALWAPVIGELSRHGRMLAPDTMGQGQTGRGLAAPSLEAAIDHVTAFLDALAVDRAHLVGHDEGAMLAVRLALLMPHRVASCTIVDSPTVAPSGDGVNSLVLQNPLQPPRSRQSLRWVVERVSASPHHYTAELEEACLAAAGTPEAVSFGAAKADNFARLRDIGLAVPAMLVWGQQDPLSPPYYGRALFDIIASRQPAMQLHVINSAGYFCYREQPGLFSRLVTGFVQAVAS